ncbi:MAG: hypothetical protein C0595_08790 [Marinilabiliales bacterium]|nr:MAG: hypothetical protein C0595_08790 [Marinilabiliales bacterium]
MADPISSPVELGFSDFVSKLISDTFEAVITTTMRQEEDWQQLNELLSQEMEVFTDMVIDDDMLKTEMIRLFPDNEGGIIIMKGLEYIKANPEKNVLETPPIESFTGYSPKGKELTEEDVIAIYSAVKSILGVKQYELLSKVFSRGATKVVVDAGKINAKLNFEILQVEDDEEETPDDPTGGGTNLNISRIFVKRKFPGFVGLSRPTELRNVHFFVKPPTDKDPQTSQVKANVYGEVEINFKTIT